MHFLLDIGGPRYAYFSRAARVALGERLQFNPPGEKPLVHVPMAVGPTMLARRVNRTPPTLEPLSLLGIQACREFGLTLTPDSVSFTQLPAWF
jgi:hypothetical protein